MGHFFFRQFFLEQISDPKVDRWNGSFLFYKFLTAGMKIYFFGAFLLSKM